MQTTQRLLQMRRERGMEIAKTGKVVFENKKWLVPSQSSSKKYEVVLGIGTSTCDCPDFITRRMKCKHIFSVEFVVLKQVDKEGNITITQTKRITYSQDWANYTKAQVEEGRLFNELLKDLIENVPEPIREGAGRPKTPLREGIFCAVSKVYSMKSSRRAHSAYEDAEHKQQITKAPNYNVINILLNDARLTPILTNLLHITAMPMKEIETVFAPDSTGFRTSNFSDYCEKKHNTKKEHKWIKAHLICGTNTNVVCDAIIDENGADCPKLIPLVQNTIDMGFRPQEISADKAYLSRDNMAFINSVNAVPFIPFKTNSIGKPMGNRVWRDMWLYFQLRQEEFLKHYHLRSNIESTNMAIKAKLGDSVKSKNFVAQKNELLCKLIAYNITVLIGAMYELKIEARFIPS
jgi:transposase